MSLLLFPSVFVLKDFKSREKEKKQMDFLYNMGKRYTHAWYARRFFNRVDVSEEPGPHFGMGLDCYVQWSSPIRRITDLQVSIFSLTLMNPGLCTSDS